MSTENQNRQLYKTLSNGMKLYKVKLVGGRSNGTVSLCSHNTVISDGEVYLRGKDDLYYHTPRLQEEPDFN